MAEDRAPYIDDVVAMQDRLALRDLVEAYATAVDSRDNTLLTSLYASGAEQTVHYPNGQTVIRRAPDLGIVEALSRRWVQTFHLVGNHRVEIDGSRASGQAYCLAHHVRGGKGAMIEHVMCIRYEDACVKTGGRWQFAKRDVHVLWSRDLAAQIIGPDVPWFEDPRAG